MANIFLGDIQLGGGGIKPVNTLPTANEENYNKHELYLNSGDLKYLDKEVVFNESNAKETIYENVFPTDANISCAGVAYCNGYFYFFGGGDGSNYGRKNTIAKMDEATRTYTKISDGMPRVMTNSACITINNYIYVIGGSTSGTGGLSTILKYDTTTNTLTTLQNTLPFTVSNYSFNQNQNILVYYWNNKYYLLYNANKYQSEDSRKIYYFDNSTESVVATNIIKTGSGGSYPSATFYNGKILYDTEYNTKELIDLTSGTKTQCTASFGMCSGLCWTNSEKGYCRDTDGNLAKMNISNSNVVTKSSTIITTKLTYQRVYQSYCTAGNKLYNFYEDKMYELSFEGYNYSYKTLSSSDVGGN